MTVQQSKRPPIMAFRRYWQPGVYFFIAIALMLVGAAAIKHQAIYDQLYDWKLIPRSERLTELYFNTSPSTYTPSADQTVAFSVHNQEHQSTDYTYTVTHSSEDGKLSQTLATGSLKLMHDHSRTIRLQPSLADLGMRTKITVILRYKGIAFGQDKPTNQTQSIYYWQAKTGNEAQ